MLVEVETNRGVVTFSGSGLGGASTGFALFIDTAIAVDSAGSGFFGGLRALARFALAARATGAVITAFGLGDALIRVAHEPSFAVAVGSAFSAFALNTHFIVLFAVIV